MESLKEIPWCQQNQILRLSCFRICAFSNIVAGMHHAPWLLIVLMSHVSFLVWQAGCKPITFQVSVYQTTYQNIVHPSMHWLKEQSADRRWRWWDMAIYLNRKMKQNKLHNRARWDASLHRSGGQCSADVSGCSCKLNLALDTWQHWATHDFQTWSLLLQLTLGCLCPPACRKQCHGPLPHLHFVSVGVIDAVLFDKQLVQLFGIISVDKVDRLGSWG